VRSPFHLVCATLAFVLVAIVGGMQARADDGTGVAAKIAAAMAAVRAMEVTQTHPGYQGTAIMQLDPTPRLHITAINPKETFESLVLDGYYFTRLCNGPWERSPTAGGIGDVMQTWTRVDPTSIAVLPDPSEPGVGAVSMLMSTAVPPGIDTATYVCTYAKGTYRLQSCTKTVLSETVTFTYDLPKTAFDPPVKWTDDTQPVAPCSLP
jgi:hypothetical protein